MKRQTESIRRLQSIRELELFWAYFLLQFPFSFQLYAEESGNNLGGSNPQNSPDGSGKVHPNVGTEGTGSSAHSNTNPAGDETTGETGPNFQENQGGDSDNSSESEQNNTEESPFRDGTFYNRAPAKVAVRV